MKPVELYICIMLLAIAATFGSLAFMIFVDAMRYIQ